MALKFTVEMEGLINKPEILEDLRTTITKKSFDVLLDLAKWTQKSIKLRAPRWSGDLAKSLRVIPKSTKEVVIYGAPYAMAQERGYTGHYVHSDMPTKGESGYTIGDWMQSKGIDVGPSGKLLWVERAPRKHFIRNGIDAGLNKLPELFRNHIVSNIEKQLNSADKLKTVTGGKR